MSKKKIVIAAEGQEISYGYFDDGYPVELYFENRERESLVGNIYAARVERVADGIGGAFLEIGAGKKCYFPLVNGRRPATLSPSHDHGIRGGDILLVQIVKDAVKTKLPVADTNLSLQGKYFVLTLEDKRFGVSKKISDKEERRRLSDLISSYKNGAYGIIVRTNAAHTEETVLLNELKELMHQIDSVLHKASYVQPGSLLYREPPHYLTLGKELPETELDEIVTDCPEIFEELKQRYGQKAALYTDEYSLRKLYRFPHFFEEALKSHVWLKSGGSLVIEQTEAMVVIDVNTGSVIGKKKQKERIFYELNREAAAEIARQLRIRNLSGIILVDFINMRDKEQQRELLSYFTEQCAKDRIPCRVVDMTALGLVEVTRSKVKRPLHEQMRRKEQI
ncbi:MAG: ribonuclease E/G [Eubacteriales bacterium]|nr:ribonuclease E/G [Eubacteriales bacterium]